MSSAADMSREVEASKSRLTLIKDTIVLYAKAIWSFTGFRKLVFGVLFIIAAYVSGNILEYYSPQEGDHGIFCFMRLMVGAYINLGIALVSSVLFAAGKAVNKRARKIKAGEINN